MEIDRPDDRRRITDQACGDDAELRDQVEALIKAADRAGSFLEAPAPGFGGGDTLSQSVVVPPAEGPGHAIGRYKLLQQIGEGGFGTVFMAEQTHPVQRK